MGIMGGNLIIFLLAVVLLIAGFIKKSKLLKIYSIIEFAISVSIFLIFWIALINYM